MFGRPRPKEGETPETALRIPAANSLEGIKKEYDALTRMFGVRDRDWKLVTRGQVAHNGRTLEKFDVSQVGAKLVEQGPPYDSVSILLSAKRWVLVSHLVRSIEPSNDQLQMLTEEMRFAVDGAIKRGISKLRRS